MTSTKAWADLTAAWIDELAAERKNDQKAFAKDLVGPKRAEAAIAQLDSLRQRLQGFVHA